MIDSRGLGELLLWLDREHNRGKIERLPAGITGLELRATAAAITRPVAASGKFCPNCVGSGDRWVTIEAAAGSFLGLPPRTLRYWVNHDPPEKLRRRKVGRTWQVEMTSLEKRIRGA